MNKQELRKLYLKNRMDIAPESYGMLNDQLLSKFKQIDFKDVSCIHLFLAMPERREPDTFLLIEWLKREHPLIKLAYPKSDFATNTMEHYLDDAELEIDSNDFGIPEPIAGNRIDAKDIDIVIAPLLAVDKGGYRVGYGKGFYDRFMATCKPSTQFVGLSFFEPVDAIEGIDTFDIRLHLCITPQKVWVFNS